MEPESILDRVMALVRTVPAIPGAVNRLLALMEEPDPDPEDVAKILRYEPGLTANVLQLTNSAFFGLPQRIGSVRQAITLLGWKRVAQLVVASCIGSMMNRPVPGYEADRGGLWKHSIWVSLTAGRLCAELKLQNQEETVTAALLHDVGKLVLGAFVKEEIGTIEELTGQGLQFVEAEHIVLGIDHAQIGGRLLESWAVPASIVHAVALHHDPESAEAPAHGVCTVHLADFACRTAQAESGPPGPCCQPSQIALDRLGLTAESAAGRAEQTREESEIQYEMMQAV